MREKKVTIVKYCDKCQQNFPPTFDHRTAKIVIPQGNDSSDRFEIKCSFSIGYGSQDADLCPLCFKTMLCKIADAI
jgi:hypothetical protein